MPAVDSFVGDGLNPSPYKEALARAERAEAELAEWRDGDHQHPLTVHGYKIMVRHLTDERRKAEAERDRYHDALIARHGGEPIALLSELDEARAERDALRADAERYRWLRGDTSPGSERWSRWNLQRWDGTCWHSLERVALDAAIDAALAREEVV